MAKLCVALDTDLERALKMLDLLKGFSLVFKVGYKLFISHHRRITDRVKELGFELFLDLKLHDIPNTVKEGVLSAKELGADYLTIHVSSGREALRQAVSVKGGMKLLGVTVLTSMPDGELNELGINRSLKEQVLELARLGLEEGLDGLVCSGEELEDLRKAYGKGFLAVVPGIRFEGESKDDQKRVITPQEAIKKGADLLVMGRSILNSEDPVKKVERVYNLISKGD